MKHLFITMMLFGWASNLVAAVPPDLQVQAASFAAQNELQVKTQIEAPIVPGPAPEIKNRQIASEKEISKKQLEERQRQLIDQEVKYWKFKND